MATGKTNLDKIQELVDNVMLKAMPTRLKNEIDKQLRLGAPKGKVLLFIKELCERVRGKNSLVYLQCWTFINQWQP